MDSKALMGREVVEDTEEEEEVVAEEVADRVDTIVIWVMVIHMVEDNKKEKNMRQIKSLSPILLLL